MRVTQGTFSYLPPLTDEQIIAQIAYAIANGWALSIEVTDDPHPRNIYWEMWGQPMFDLTDPAGVMVELRGCRAAFPNSYIKLNAYDARLGRQTTALSFITDRPAEEPRFVLDRQEDAGRSVRYSLRPHATPQASGQPYTG